MNRFQSEYYRETDRLFRNTIRIVNDLGDTLRGVCFEVLLHDVRNPLRSIIAAKNTEAISKRRLGDPSTRFVVQYVRDQGRQLIEAMEAGSKVAYPKRFFQTKDVKATTTPLYDEVYGLIGILCINIDVDSVRSLEGESLARFLENYTATEGETPEFEKSAAPSRGIDRVDANKKDGEMLSRDMSISGAFAYVGAPLRNVVWSWGATRESDNAVFLRVWADEELVHSGKRYTCVNVGSLASAEAGTQGFNERRQHVELIRNGSPAYMIMCHAVDTKASPRKIKSFNRDDVFVGGELIEHGGDWWLERRERQPFEQVHAEKGMQA